MGIVRCNILSIYIYIICSYVLINWMNTKHNNKWMGVNKIQKWDWLQANALALSYEQRAVMITLQRQTWKSCSDLIYYLFRYIYMSEHLFHFFLIGWALRGMRVWPDEAQWCSKCSLTDECGAQECYCHSSARISGNERGGRHMHIPHTHLIGQTVIELKFNWLFRWFCKWD